MKYQSALEDFLLACAADGLRKSTLVWYRSLLSAFADQTEPASLETITAADLRRYLFWIRDTDYSVDTINAHTRALHRFFAWAAQEYDLRNPMRNIRYPDKPQPKPRAITMDDAQRIFEEAGSSRSPERDRAIVALLIDTGCRAAGLCSLQEADVDLNERRALVTEKGNRTRAVIFTTFTADLIREWERLRSPESTVFYNVQTFQPLTTNGLYQLLRRLAHRAGIQGRFNPHSFRHLFAKEYIRAGGDLATLSRLMGHRDVSTTVAHYTIFTDSEIREKHETYSPARKLRDSG